MDLWTCLSCASPSVLVELGSEEFAGDVGGLGLFACWAPFAAGCGSLGVLVPLYFVQHLQFLAIWAAMAFMFDRTGQAGL